MKTLIVAALLLLTGIAHADEPVVTLTQSQNPNAVYRLFNTRNTFNLLLLNTTNGSIEKIQWDGKGKNTFHVPLPRCIGAMGDSHPGRYTLQATPNIWTFIMLDQDAGNTWYVQWSVNDDNDFCQPIKSESESIAPPPRQ
jgi:hypothetical protein